MGKNKKIYFVGIGGIGMSALAQLYREKGLEVCGSDRSASEVTELLEEKKIKVFIGHHAENVPKDSTLLVYSDAVPVDNQEREKARRLGIPEKSYFEALGEATSKGVSLVVSGTHGKTTTTAMLAKILIDAGERPTVIAGSILKEYGSNFVSGRDDLFIIEGCEYRRHFLNLHPTILVITNIDLDHTDYYRDIFDMQSAFGEMIERIPKDGAVVTNTSSATIAPVLAKVTKRIEPYQGVSVPKLFAIGEFNRENARAAKKAVLALFPHIHEDGIDASLSAYSGTWRRFEYKGKTEKGAMLYDDYAHHPTAVQATIETAKKEFSEKHIVVIFHPHLYSRTKQFFAEFSSALALADETILLPVYAAREAPDPSVRSEMLAVAVEEKGGKGLYAEDFEKAETMLKKYGPESIIITMGAGDVYQIGNKMAQGGLVGKTSVEKKD